MSAASKEQPGRPATLEDLLAMPEEDRYEIVDGELVPKEAGSGKHGRTQVNVSISLGGPFGRRPPGGPPDRPGGWWFATEVLIEFSPTQQRRPDVAGWRRERLPEMPGEVPITVLPDWICEVLSPTNASNDTVTKMRLYHRHQVPHYWLIDPIAETLSVYRYTPDGYLHVLSAKRGERVRAEPFDAIELQVGVFFGDDEE
jgi:Uma2 family endonuclease